MFKSIFYHIFVLLVICGCSLIYPGTYDKAYPEISISTKAPGFWMKNQDQARVTLSEFAGKKNVILVFFPLAFTPV